MHSGAALPVMRGNLGHCHAVFDEQWIQMRAAMGSIEHWSHQARAALGALALVGER